ncbi:MULTISPECIES: hypothetical protein [unclassified Mesorhizobium]|uniref:hypothetical protein n=1 Tax=unclassified Mesorhizobium TaxID=325217 RepID=UPI001CCF945C|nr:MULTISPECIES: hypothetical protein [unclassified Mesorhizobium]MBZ9739989.1 hypothetical protein [Mesorhizobium sp. CO1-1-4]MBZ9806161.1 hypothetical protein [Mesorhizobium sp. ES1-6]
MNQKIIGYGRGGAVGVSLGHILYMIFNGDDLHSIVASAAMYAAIGICIVLLIERGLRRWGKAYSKT